MQPSTGGTRPGSNGFFGGNGIGFGGFNGGLATLLQRRYNGVAPFPGTPRLQPLPPPSDDPRGPQIPALYTRPPKQRDENTETLLQLGMSPSEWLRRKNREPFQELRDLVASRDYVNSVSGFGPFGGGFGAGFGDPADLYRKLLQQRQGVQF